MLAVCANPDELVNFMWYVCYLTNGKHLAFYLAFIKVICLLSLAAPAALSIGFIVAAASRSEILPLYLLGNFFILIVRGIPDIAWFLFFVIALDQGFETVRHFSLCPMWQDAIRQGSNFIVCQSAKLPRNDAPGWHHEVYAFILAIITFSIVFGAFCGNVMKGAMEAVPKGQLETGAAFGMTDKQIFWKILVPQMWRFAIPGLANVWMILIKATPLLFLLGIEDIVYWARELGGTKTPRFTSYPHGDWRLWYFLVLIVFYLMITQFSEYFLKKIHNRFSRGFVAE